MFNLKNKQLEDHIIEIISQSDLPIYNIYLIIHKIYYELQDLCNEQVSKEFSELSKNSLIEETIEPIHINLNELEKNEEESINE